VDAVDTRCERAAVVDRVVRAGEDLSLNSLRWGQRPSPAPALGMTERDLRLMARLHDVNYLSASQLVMLGWGASRMRAGQKRLKLLHDGGFLDRFRPVCAIGSAEWIYRLGARGWQALTAKHIVDDNARYAPAALTSISYTEHDLQLAALILRIALDAGGKVTRGLIDSMPFEWQGPRRGRIDPDGHEKVERSPAAKLDERMRLRPCQNRRGYLEPDATLIGGSGERRWAVLIEYDRTDRPHKQIDRLLRYDWWLLEGWRHTHFATHAIAPTVVFLTSRERPLRRLIRTADQVLSAWYAQHYHGPREGAHPAREQILFTSRERILAGDWTMQRTPGLAPELRENPREFWSGAVVYDLPALLRGDPTSVADGLGSRATDRATTASATAA
jgi:hypothetical protein